MLYTLEMYICNAVENPLKGLYLKGSDLPTGIRACWYVAFSPSCLFYIRESDNKTFQ